MPLVRAYLALGSNLGDRMAQMREALALLRREYGVQVLRTSPVYRNRAVGMGDADDFLNAVAEVATELLPEPLLDACLAVESKLGRVRTGAWAPRTIDLDLLVYGEVRMDTERLQLPHPRITERDFVAKPLMDLTPELNVFGRPVREWVAALPELELELIAASLLDSDS